MRILFISTTFPDAMSPARGTYNSALCAALAVEHEVRVISPRSFLEAIPAQLRHGTYRLPKPLQQLGIQASYPTFWHTPGVLQEKLGDQMWWSVHHAVRLAIDEFQPDAVLSYWAHPEGEVGVRAAHLADVPSAVIIGGSDVLVLPKLPKRGDRVRDVLLQSSNVITVSNGLREKVIELGVHPDRVNTIYQGINPEEFHHRISRAAAQASLDLSPESKHLVWVGRMVPVKAMDLLVDAAALLKQQNLACQIHLLGDGPERKRIEHRVQNLGLAKIVKFEGAIGHDRIADWYRAADLTLLSSDSEGLPNVLRESLACGTPFVSTDVGSIREIAETRFSQLVPTRQPRELARAIQHTLSPEFATEALGIQARTWEETARETIQLFDRLHQEFGTFSGTRTDSARILKFQATLTNQ